MKATPRFIPSLLARAIACFAACFLTHCATTPVSTGGGASSANLQTTTKESPYVNSLGMKFVPIPGTNILMCTTETTIAQYQQSGLPFQGSEYPQSSNHPVVNMTGGDAAKFCEWLSRQDKHTYRLPTEAEWLAAAGKSPGSWPPPGNAGNLAGQELKGSSESERTQLKTEFSKKVPDQHYFYDQQQLAVIRDAMTSKNFLAIGGYTDRHRHTAPVGSYAPNSLGLYDMVGNVSEVCDGWVDKMTGLRVTRGSNWKSAVAYAIRNHERGTLGNSDWPVKSLAHSTTTGFRCVLVR
ncbi:SUMF1/EgtB/PvdO family nonheme iron enzyme [Luteolibacter ambystomatis]|uniref:SUMF1/EgtB/PvdO family nonheme iron enzyme n=1 Tax=Luteolibacter ambystomatis TaxID=2824561 RepID=A0A975G7E2_9BACT|nr:SUMF1/EgtB/PvdO family nonheme iron enzyme [Luteolibacter ambystomatis]QUE50183.1 SUMF1/EgtB/PvdO family nonheme iron enzyme [Luteolibacter ambystomatis]